MKKDSANKRSEELQKNLYKRFDQCCSIAEYKECKRWEAKIEKIKEMIKRNSTNYADYDFDESKCCILDEEINEEIDKICEDKE